VFKWLEDTIEVEKGSKKLKRGLKSRSDGYCVEKLENS